ncbi:MAG TPA: 30S ribosomal protein S16 [Candidatus Paceibacterota bacterium]
MLMIRMQRIGRTNDPAFRVVVLEKTSSPKAGTYTDLLGTYNPKTKAFTMAEDRLKDWMSKGAQLSPSLSNLLISKKIIEGKKSAVVSKKNLEKNKAKEEAAAPAAEAAAPAEAVAEAAPAAEEAASEAAVAEADVVEEPAAPAAEAAEAPAETPAA